LICVLRFDAVLGRRLRIAASAAAARPHRGTTARAHANVAAPVTSPSRRPNARDIAALRTGQQSQRAREQRRLADPGRGGYPGATAGATVKPP
jgi:hypothetical protein